MKLYIKDKYIDLRYELIEDSENKGKYFAKSEKTGWTSDVSKSLEEYEVYWGEVIEDDR